MLRCSGTGIFSGDRHHSVGGRDRAETRFCHLVDAHLALPGGSGAGLRLGLIRLMHDLMRLILSAHLRRLGLGLSRLTHHLVRLIHDLMQLASGDGIGRRRDAADS